ncbi:MAG: TRAP transporter large permease subunit [Thermoanaerobaculia bacterium]
MGLIAAWGVREWSGAAPRSGGASARRRALLRRQVVEVLLPVVALGATGGFATPGGGFAYTALYALLVELVVHRALPWRKLPKVLVECMVLLGGVLLILGVAK